MNGIIEAAERLYERSPTWVQFYRQVFGVDGLVRSRLNQEQREQFEQTEDHATIQEMMADLRSTETTKKSFAEPEQMITIRIPVSLHKVLILESNENGISLNKLAITKLLQPLIPRFTPLQSGKRRGRRSPFEY